MEKEKIRVVYVEPGQLARITELTNELKEMQNAVKGDIEPYYPFDEDVCLVCNDEGKINGMDFNRAIYDENGEKAEEFAAVLTTDGAYKAAEFVTFCNAFEIPVLSLTNVKGFEANVRAEKTIAKAAAKLVYAFSNADVPKVNVITGEAYGSAYVAMNSKSVGADMVYAWSQASIGMMDASLAAKIMYADEIAAADDVTAKINEKASEYAALQSSVEQAAARGYVDTIINPEDTRKYIIAAFEMLFDKREVRADKKHGTV